MIPVRVDLTIFLKSLRNGAAADNRFPKRILNIKRELHAVESIMIIIGCPPYAAFNFNPKTFVTLLIVLN
jgi:hypothetical protein